MLRRLAPLVVLVLPCWGQSQKEMIQVLQRDVATLQDQVRTLERGFLEKMGQLQNMLQQSIDSSKDVNRAITLLDGNIAGKLADQAKQTSQPIANLNLKVDQMSGEFEKVSAGMSDVLNRLGKLEQKLVDLDNALRTLQQPPPAPGPAGGTAAAGSSGAVVPASTLYNTAFADKTSGKPDLALKGFQEYLRLYANTDLAPNAQYHIGEIYFLQSDYDRALEAFDAVLNNFGEHPKIPDAMLLKGKTLLKMGKRTEAVSALRKLNADYPDSDAAPRGCLELKALTFSCSTPASKKKTRR